jgi:hypothetical protein
MWDGALQCWGNGALGDGTQVGRACAAPVEALTDVTEVFSGMLQSCSLAPKGISCWGGEIEASGDITYYDVPTTVHFF